MVAKMAPTRIRYPEAGRAPSSCTSRSGKRPAPSSELAAHSPTPADRRPLTTIARLLNCKIGPPPLAAQLRTTQSREERRGAELWRSRGCAPVPRAARCCAAPAPLVPSRWMAKRCGYPWGRATDCALLPLRPAPALAAVWTSIGCVSRLVVRTVDWNLL